MHMMIQESISLPGSKSDFYPRQKNLATHIIEILILTDLQKYMHYATHRNPLTYRSTSNFASSVLRILEERAFAVGNYQSIIAITKIITVIVVIVIMLNDIPTSWELLAICLAFFPPSDTFFPYLLSFIQKVSGNL